MMEVVLKKGGEYQDCIVSYFGFDKYSQPSEEKVFFWGYRCLEDEYIKKQYSHIKNRIFLDTASPCAFLSSRNFLQNCKYFTKIYTICPWTADFLNANGVSSEAVCFPYPAEHFEKFNNISSEDKQYDCIYYGQIHDDYYFPMLRSISNFNYKYTTISNHGMNAEMSNLVTDKNLSTIAKWESIALSKSCVGINLLFPKNHSLNCQYYIDNYNMSDDLRHILTQPIMPQMKTRMVEAAACKTLMLIHKDEYNVIENWFKPDKHFLYWNDQTELTQILNDVRDNYHQYWDIVENAHQHVKQYSIFNFWSKINEQ